MKTVKEWMATFEGLNSLDAARVIFEHMRCQTIDRLQSEREQDIANALDAFARLVVKRAFFGV